MRSYTYGNLLSCSPAQIICTYLSMLIPTWADRSATTLLKAWAMWCDSVNLRWILNTWDWETYGNLLKHVPRSNFIQQFCLVLPKHPNPYRARLLIGSIYDRPLWLNTSKALHGWSAVDPWCISSENTVSVSEPRALQKPSFHPLEARSDGSRIAPRHISSGFELQESTARFNLRRALCTLWDCLPGPDHCPCARYFLLGPRFFPRPCHDVLSLCQKWPYRRTKKKCERFIYW